MGQFTFRVRKLPDPTPYITLKDDQGNPTRYKGGNLSKQALMGADGIGAAIDDGILDIGFKVLAFECVFFDNMGNAVPMVSDGSNFSARQKDTFRKLQRNRRFYKEARRNPLRKMYFEKRDDSNRLNLQQADNED